MVLLHPLKVVITNLDTVSVENLDAKMWPDAQQTMHPSSMYKVPFTHVVYIDHSDFRLKDTKDYFGLAPGKSVLLRVFFIGLRNHLLELNLLKLKSGYLIRCLSPRIMLNRITGLLIEIQNPRKLYQMHMLYLLSVVPS